MDQENKIVENGTEAQSPKPQADPAPQQDPVSETAAHAEKEQAPKKKNNAASVKKSAPKKSDDKAKSEKGGNRTNASTASASGKKTAEKAVEKRKKESDPSSPRSAKTAHRLLPYLLGIFAVFVGLALLFNLFCNQQNILKETPSEHWMGSVGYWICYLLFGLFGPAVFVLPLLLANLAIYWKKFIDNRIAISKIVASVAFLVLLGALIHVFSLSLWTPDTRHLTAAQLMEVGGKMTMGGVLGGGIGYFLASYLNIAGAVILLFCLLFVLLFYVIGMTPHHLWSYVRARMIAKREGRGTVSEKDAQAAQYDAKMQEKLKKTAARRETDGEEVDEDGIPTGAVIRKDSPKAETPAKTKGDRLAPMPIPMLNPHEGKLFVPADVNKKMAMGASAQQAPQTARTAPTAPQTVTATSAETAPVQKPPVNPAANKDHAVDPIFPKNERVVRTVSKSDRGFDLKDVFVNNGQTQTAPAKTVAHSPVPPEVPMPKTAQKPAAAPSATVASAPAAKVATVAKAAPAADAQKPTAPAHQPTVREVKDLAQKDFGLTSEEFEKIEAQHRTLPKAGEQGAKKVEVKKIVKTVAPVPAKPKKYVFPPMTYLHAPEPMTAENQEEIRSSVEKLSTTLQNFRISIDGIDYSHGPTVTRYELTPSPGVRVRSIVNLADDISLVFASKVRIEAPIPGKSAVGIEVPNKLRSNIFLRELLESKSFTESQSKLTACLGADVTGKPLYFDIAKMPHLLVAGATGMGKSVCINSIIMSLLYKARPDEVKLVLIDPKKVEFGIYKGIPHLLAPIVTAPKDAAGALQAAVEEMELRFELIQQVGARDIKGYNQVTANDPDMPFMPQIVIIIDELADLMMSAPDEVETAICRLAQKARAAGMHIIIGTQRPSVDVVTGLIKSNVPSRIAFTVASQVDSRTILDVAGAEKLIGKGDMLFAPVGAMGFTRVQGAFVDEKEVESICEFIRATNGSAVYDERFTNKMKEFSAQCGQKGKNAATADASPLPEGGKGDDSKYSDAVRIAVEEKKISTSLLQRKLTIGYSRAAKLIDRMQEEGLVSAPDGSKPRTVLITPEEYIEKFVDVPTEEQS